MKIHLCSLLVVTLVLFLGQLASAEETTTDTWNNFYENPMNSMNDRKQISKLLWHLYRWMRLTLERVDITYRKAVVFAHKQMTPNRYLESERIRYMTYVQNAYLKIYHLTHMMHEIDPKYNTENGGQISLDYMNVVFQSKTPSYYNTSGFEYTEQLNAIREARVKERRKKVMREKRIRQKEMDTMNKVYPGTIKTTTNWWPMNYGWDIDYYW
ncbi:uncharacterized protein LOC125239553 isoform X2 [Leguminivora glycinivorella]|uniref:uncharacterized protein LOC125239553 isoform X2 n=1 Tax=Leguminivora glycinivorella TaxID=1035111 RepID=UPI00200C2B51|nr:uncharacterized protein LOC125239553 isoform X2 [Leguminivora glycinivorella]